MKATDPVDIDVDGMNNEEFKRLLAVADTSPPSNNRCLQTDRGAGAFSGGAGVAARGCFSEWSPNAYHRDGHKLMSVGVIPRSEVNTFQQLRELRNRVAHAFDNEITGQTAREYVRLADRYADVLNQAVKSREIQMNLFNQT